MVTSNTHPPFVPIPGYDGRYSINVNAQVMRNHYMLRRKDGAVVEMKAKPIKARVDRRSGYLVVKLTNPDGTYGTQYLHRLLAIVFLSKKGDRDYVNHKNGNKLDCCLENLEWVTPSENHKHAIRMNLAKIPKDSKVPLVDTCTGRVYESIKAAALTLGIDYEKLKRIFRGLDPNNTCLRKAVDLVIPEKVTGLQLNSDTPESEEAQPTQEKPCSPCDHAPSIVPVQHQRNSS